jgi:bacterioferritin
MDQDEFTELLNEDLSTEYQSIVKSNLHMLTVTGPGLVSAIDELTRHLSQELDDAGVLASQVSFLGGEPTTVVRSVPVTKESRGALEADPQLEQDRLERYRERFAQAIKPGLADVGEALRPLLEQTQEHVQDLQTDLGR